MTRAPSGCLKDLLVLTSGNENVHSSEISPFTIWSKMPAHRLPVLGAFAFFFFFSSVRQMKPILVNSLVRVNRHKVSLLTQRESRRAVVSVSFPASGREGDGGPRAPRDSHRV